MENMTLLGDIPGATAEDVNIAVEAARRALAGEWGSTTGAQRAKYLRSIAAKVCFLKLIALFSELAL